jgi:hypothetical protein
MHLLVYLLLCLNSMNSRKWNVQDHSSINLNRSNWEDVLHSLSPFQSIQVCVYITLLQYMHFTLNSLKYYPFLKHMENPLILLISCTFLFCRITTFMMANHPIYSLSIGTQKVHINWGSYLVVTRWINTSFGMWWLFLMWHPHRMLTRQPWTNQWLTCGISQMMTNGTL